MHHRRLQNTKDKREILKAARRDRALCKKTKQSCFRLASTMETSRSQNDDFQSCKRKITVNLKNSLIWDRVMWNQNMRVLCVE